MMDTKNNKSMINYINQNGCYCCKWVFKRYEHDEETKLFCNDHNAGTRPLCMSVAMNEAPDDPTFLLCDRWDEWSKERSVNSWGICDKFKRNNT